MTCTGKKKPAGDTTPPTSCTDSADFTSSIIKTAIVSFFLGLAISSCSPAYAGAAHGTIRPGARHTLIGSAAAAPAASGASSRSDFADAGYPASHGFGRGAVVRKASGMAEPMCLTPRPPVALRQASGGSQSRSGATMHPATTVASAAARSTTNAPTEEERAYALLQALSSASLARLYLHKNNVPAARRQAVLLLKTLQTLEAA